MAYGGGSNTEMSATAAAAEAVVGLAVSNIKQTVTLYDIPIKPQDYTGLMDNYK